MTSPKALQDLIHNKDPLRGCYGCGADNERGLRIKTYLEGAVGVAKWRPQPHHQSFTGFLNGGVASTLIDCHSACTAIALECLELGIDLEQEPEKMPPGWTRAMSIEFIKATPLDAELTLRAEVIKKGKKSRTVACSLFARGEECVRAEVTVVITSPKPADG